jgi:transcriptional regulator GlxA family with amidase domain
VDEGHGLFQHAGAADGTEPVGPGSVVLIEPGAWHACNPAPQAEPGPARWSYRMLYLQAGWLHERLGVAGLRFARRTVRDAAATAMVDGLCQALATSAPLDADAWARRLADWLCQPGIARPVATAPAPADAGSHTAIEGALQRLHAQPGQSPSVQTLAQACGMSAPRFIRRFRAATGVTPGAYRLNLRINGARQLLAQGVPLAEAAQAMGFADQAHLQRSFKAHHALTPGRYAQGMRV